MEFNEIARALKKNKKGYCSMLFLSIAGILLY
jgi:hypothetical protein